MQEQPSSPPGNLTPLHPHSLEMEDDPEQVTMGISVGAAHRQRSRPPKSYAAISPLHHIFYMLRTKSST